MLDAGFTFEQERPPQRHREEHGGGDAVVGQVRERVNGRESVDRACDHSLRADIGCIPEFIVG